MVVESSGDEEDDRIQHLPIATNPERRSRGSTMGTTERSPLLGRSSSNGQHNGPGLEGESPATHDKRSGGLLSRGRQLKSRVGQFVNIAVKPKNWDRKAIWDTTVVAPVSCLPAVCVGLLLNILDALSYGESRGTKSYTMNM